MGNWRSAVATPATLLVLAVAWWLGYGRPASTYFRAATAPNRVRPEADSIATRPFVLDVTYTVPLGSIKDDRYSSVFIGCEYSEHTHGEPVPYAVSIEGVTETRSHTQNVSLAEARHIAAGIDSLLTTVNRIKGKAGSQVVLLQAGDVAVHVQVAGSRDYALVLGSELFLIEGNSVPVIRDILSTAPVRCPAQAPR